MDDMSDHLPAVLKQDKCRNSMYLYFNKYSLKMVIVYIISYNKLSSKLFSTLSLITSITSFETTKTVAKDIEICSVQCENMTLLRMDDRFVYLSD